MGTINICISLNLRLSQLFTHMLWGQFTSFISLNLRHSQLFTHMPWGQFTFLFPWTYVSLSYSHICHGDNLHFTSLTVIHSYAMGTINIFISLNLRLSQLFTHMPWGQFTFLFPWTYVSRNHSHICYGDNLHFDFLELTSLAVIAGEICLTGACVTFDLVHTPAVITARIRPTLVLTCHGNKCKLFNVL